MIPQISPDEARQAFDDGACFVDIRDPQSVALARIRGAVPLTRELLDAFLAHTPREQPLIVYCYHGHSSLDATAFLLEQGFSHVHSLSGGFEYWRGCHPDTVDGAA
jgi:thiosulfate sulfurtransferase